ncbi:MAG: helix-turn-helix domain-containing protein [Clostridiales bacterium]|jgi:transcriptional regulator with XRE-family HTH domain|nr:helix-turn-helix domain-containing protein [Clostridiales bacterium]
MSIFSKRLIELRKLNKYTQRYMATLLDIKQSSYLRYENGTAEPTHANLVKLADALDVSTDYLLGRGEY